MTRRGTDAASTLPITGEALVWRAVGEGWKQLFGSFNNLGVSFEWHDFKTSERIDWGKSFHPGSLELCLNLSGAGVVRTGGQTIEYKAMTGGFYARGDQAIEAYRVPNELHQFVTVEFAPGFLSEHLRAQKNVLHPLVRGIVEQGKVRTGVGAATRLNTRQQQLVASLTQPPVMQAAQALWYQSKALELIVEFFFEPPEEQELFCARQQRVSKDRVEKVIALLAKNLNEPPMLEDIGRQVGCSPFYLSRTFSKEVGMTIPQYLRKLRMEKAAELLRSGKFNVTEAALEVGYSSLSHFSAAFHETFGCCPGLYSMMPGHNGVAKK